MRLRRFTTAAAAQVSSWATSPDEVLAWCSPTGAPVPAEVIAGWSKAADADANLLVDDAGERLAYGEPSADDEEHDVELARLIVAPELRSRGIGRQLVAMLTELAVRRHPVRRHARAPRQRGGWPGADGQDGTGSKPGASSMPPNTVPVPTCR